MTSESELLAILERLDGLVWRCTSGDLSFSDFLSAYDNAYDRYALDGHEASGAELKWLARHRSRIGFHLSIRDQILYNICSEEDAKRESYRKAGRFGAREAECRLREIVGRHGLGE